VYCLCFQKKGVFYSFGCFFSAKDWRKIVHFVSDAMHVRLTGEKGHFNTKMAYISEEKDSNYKSIRRICCYDSRWISFSLVSKAGSYAVILGRFYSVLVSESVVNQLNNQSAGQTVNKSLVLLLNEFIRLKMKVTPQDVGGNCRYEVS
jgi:hypothetical protein